MNEITINYFPSVYKGIPFVVQEAAGGYIFQIANNQFMQTPFRTFDDAFIAAERFIDEKIQKR